MKKKVVINEKYKTIHSLTIKYLLKKIFILILAQPPPTVSWLEVKRNSLF